VRQRPRAGPEGASLPSERPSPGERGPRPPSSGRHDPRAPPGHLPGWVDHGSPQAASDGDHRAPRAAPPRRVQRLVGLHLLGSVPRLEYRDPHRDRARIHRGAPFRLDAHFARLRHSLEILGIEFAWPVDELRQAARKIAESNAVSEGLIRITITAGERATTRGSAAITSRALPEVPDHPT